MALSSGLAYQGRPGRRRYLRLAAGYLILAALLALICYAATQAAPAAPIVGPANPPSAACADPYEPDNSAAEATRTFLMDGGREDHTFDLDNDQDYFRIPVQIGGVYTLTTSNLTAKADTILRLYGADGATEIVANDDIHWPDDKASRITWVAAYDGVYYAQVRDFYWRGNCLGYSIDGQAAPRRFGSYLPMLSVPLPTATPTPAPAATDTPSPTPTVTDTPTATPTPSITPTPTNTYTPAPIVLPTSVAVAGLQYPNALAVDPGTHRVYITSRDNDRLIALDGMNLGVVNATQVGKGPWGLALNPATRKLYVANFGSSDVYVLDADSLARLGRIPLSAGAPAELTFLALNPQTDRIFAVNHAGNELIVIDGATGVLERRVATGGYGAWGLAVNTDLNRVYVSHRDSNTVATFDGNANYARLDGQTIRACGNQGSPYSLAFNPTLAKLYMACASGGFVDTAVVLRAGPAGLTRLAWLPIDNGGQNGGGGIAVDAATANVFFTNSTSNTVSVVGGSSDALAGSAYAGPNPFGIAADPGTRRIFAGDRDNNQVYVLQDNWPAQ